MASPIFILVEGLVVIIIIGGLYSLYASTRSYGGLMGSAIRLLGIGMLFVILAAIEKILMNFSILEDSNTVGLIQDGFNLVGILFLGLGFSKLASIAKS